MSSTHQQIQDVGIVISQAKSDQFTIDGFSAGSFQVPAAFTSTAVANIEVSLDGVGAFDILRGVDGLALAYTPAVAVGTVIPFPAGLFNFRVAQFVFGSSEVAARVIKVFLRD